MEKEKEKDGRWLTRFQIRDRESISKIKSMIGIIKSSKKSGRQEIIKRETDNKHKEIAVQMMMEEKEKVTRDLHRE